jgi:hypothetical protein
MQLDPAPWLNKLLRIFWPYSVKIYTRNEWGVQKNPFEASWGLKIYTRNECILGKLLKDSFDRREQSLEDEELDDDELEGKTHSKRVWEIKTTLETSVRD